MTQRTREFHLVSRPVGTPQPSDFALVERELPDPADGEVLIRNLFLSVDPYMRGRMNEAKSYAPPYRLNEAMTGGAIGEVTESRSPDLSVGDLVLHDEGWREHAVVGVGQVRRITPADGAPSSAYLGVLGMTGLTAYVGLLDVANLKPGDAVFVSGAAGAVGSIVGQIAKLRGASRVIGSAGSDRKVEYLTGRLGFDAAFNYKTATVRELLAKAAPDGIDVYFDNVGGDHLEAAIGAMRLHGRAAICGAISVYNATEPAPGPRNLPLLVGRRVTLSGFLVNDHYDRFGAFVDEVGGWLADGKISYSETVTDGVDNAVEAFLAMLRGENTGKAIIRLPH